MTRRTLALLAVAVATIVACTEDHVVLVATPLVTTCSAAFAAGSGSPCNFTGTCTQATVANPDCCTDSASCSEGQLVFAQPVCKASCVCTTDTDCPTATSICNGTTCEACPPVDTCAACPTGWTRLTRNGCQVCDCAPPATCTSGASSISANSCPGAEMCYRGEDCTSGCATNELGCCSDQCAAAGCTGPIPVGCLASCTAAQPGCTTCAATSCTCESGQWNCTVGCVEGAHASCVAP
jgi:hypothetical protein